MTPLLYKVVVNHSKIERFPIYFMKLAKNIFASKLIDISEREKFQVNDCN